MDPWCLWCIYIALYYNIMLIQHISWLLHEIPTSIGIGCPIKLTEHYITNKMKSAEEKDHLWNWTNPQLQTTFMTQEDVIQDVFTERGIHQGHSKWKHSRSHSAHSAL